MERKKERKKKRKGGVDIGARGTFLLLFAPLQKKKKKKNEKKKEEKGRGGEGATGGRVDFNFSHTPITRIGKGGGKGGGEGKETFAEWV